MGFSKRSNAGKLSGGGPPPAQGLPARGTALLAAQPNEVGRRGDSAMATSRGERWPRGPWGGSFSSARTPVARTGRDRGPPRAQMHTARSRARRGRGAPALPLGHRVPAGRAQGRCGPPSVRGGHRAGCVTARPVPGRKPRQGETGKDLGSAARRRRERAGLSQGRRVTRDAPTKPRGGGSSSPDGKGWGRGEPNNGPPAPRRGVGTKTRTHSCPGSGTLTSL